MGRPLVCRTQQKKLILKTRKNVTVLSVGTTQTAQSACSIKNLTILQIKQPIIKNKKEGG